MSTAVQLHWQYAGACCDNIETPGKSRVYQPGFVPVPNHHCRDHLDGTIDYTAQASMTG